jgi:hypothetical protein
MHRGSKKYAGRRKISTRGLLLPPPEEDRLMRMDRAEEVRTRVKAVVSDGTLPADARDYGEQLLRRFGKPVRIAILGLPGSGKTQLLNMLVGRRLIPDGSSLPALEVIAGASWRTRVAREGDTTQSFDRLVTEGPELAGAWSLTLEAPLGVLERISLLEVAADAKVDSQLRAVETGAKHAEILIWCTQEFTEVERMLWKHVPGALKDHAFLAVTKADELQRAGLLPQRLASMNSALAEEFCDFLPVATLRALAALDDGENSQSAFAASGGRALRNAVLKHVEQGRRADLDNALLFLRRYETAGGGTGVPRLADATGAAADASVVSSRKRAFADQALNHFRDCANILAQLAPEGGTDKYAKFLSACADALDGLSELLATQGSAAASASFHDTLSEASEMLLLLRLEKGAGPAADAATLLLQVRRELEEELA